MVHMVSIWSSSEWRERFVTLPLGIGLLFDAISAEALTPNKTISLEKKGNHAQLKHIWQPTLSTTRNRVAKQADGPANGKESDVDIW